MAMSKEAKAGMAGAVVLGVLIFVALYAFGAAAPGNEASGPPFPSGADCPSAEQAQRFDQTGAATTDYVDAPTGRLLLSYEFPDAPAGVIFRLDVKPERESISARDVKPLGTLGALREPTKLAKNQGQVLLEDVPGRYRFGFSPSDPNQEYVVVAYRCGPSDDR